MSTAQQPKASTSQSPARNKLIVRRLPPTLPEEIFWQAVSPWITTETCLWKRYVKGRVSEGHDTRPVYSRAYVLMGNVDAVIAFHRGFDGHVFRSKAGVEFQAVVEFSPVQKTPLKSKNKADARQGTIDDDSDYKSFLEVLNAPVQKQPLETSAPLPQPTSTPLLDHLRATAANKAAKKKAKAKAPPEGPRDAALASVNKATAKQMAAATGPTVMIAGKGRGVMITPTSGAADVEPGEGSGAKKGRNRKKGKQGSGADAAVATAEGGSAPKQVLPKAPPKKPDPPTGPAGVPRGSESGRGRPRAEGAPRGGGTGGGGRGKDGKVRSAHDAVKGILTRNAENDKNERSGRGRGGGRGGVRGGRGGTAASALSDPAASLARIDM